MDGDLRAVIFTLEKAKEAPLDLLAAVERMDGQIKTLARRVAALEGQADPAPAPAPASPQSSS